MRTRLPLQRRLLHSVSDKFKPKKSLPWTTRLASLAAKKEGTSKDYPKEILNQEDVPCVDLSLRLEGPYFTAANPYSYSTIICLVAGTGVTGALAIGAAFNKLASSSPSSIPAGNSPTKPRCWTRCCILWSVKADQEIDLPFLEPLAEGLEVRKFLTGRRTIESSGTQEKRGEDGRLNMEKEVVDRVFPARFEGERTWVYISGPKRFIASAKTACSNVEKMGARLDFYAASWDP